MMDNLLYVLITNIIIYLSLIGLIVLIAVHIIRKKKFNVWSYILLVMFLIGMYLYIPLRYAYLGYDNQKPELLEKAIKFSVNPYEKRLCNKYIAEAYAEDIFHQGIKDGNKAIEYMEKAIKGEYQKYFGETTILAYWYSIKGDYDKTLELNNILNVNKGLSLRNIYIKNNEYEKAISAFIDNKNIDNYLKAALYRELGQNEEAKKAEELATQTYNEQVELITDEERLKEFNEKTDRYRSIEAYKNWLEQEAKEYKFI